MDLVR